MSRVERPGNGEFTHLMGVEYDFARFRVGTGDNHQTVKRRVDADKRGVIVIAKDIARAVLDEVQAHLIHGEP